MSLSYSNCVWIENLPVAQRQCWHQTVVKADLCCIEMASCGSPLTLFVPAVISSPSSVPLAPSLRGMTFSAEMRPCWQLHTRTGKWTQRTDEGNHVWEPACNSCFTHLQTEGMSKTDSSVRRTIYESDPALMLSRLEGLVLLRELSQSFPHPHPLCDGMVWI